MVRYESTRQLTIENFENPFQQTLGKKIMYLIK